MRGSASASIVPRMQATTAFPSAMSTLRLSASVISGVRSATSNHRVEKPSQKSTSRPPLNARATTTRIGAYRKTYTRNA
jgi:hypothetical protein